MMISIKKLSHGVWAIFKYVLLFVVIYVVVNAWRSPDMPASPMLSYQNSQGMVVDVVKASYDKPMLVYFWGTWCGVCRLTSPNIQALHADGHDVLTVAVSSGSDDELLAYMNQHGYDFYTMNDHDGAIFSQWQGQVTPSFVILNDGKMTQSFTGITPLWLLKLRLLMAEI